MKVKKLREKNNTLNCIIFFSALRINFVVIKNLIVKNITLFTKCKLTHLLLLSSFKIKNVDIFKIILFIQRKFIFFYTKTLCKFYYSVKVIFLLKYLIHLFIRVELTFYKTFNLTKRGFVFIKKFLYKNFFKYNFKNINLYFINFFKKPIFYITSCQINLNNIVNKLKKFKKIKLYFFRKNYNKQYILFIVKNSETKQPISPLVECWTYQNNLNLIRLFLKRMPLFIYKFNNVDKVKPLTVYKNFFFKTNLTLFKYQDLTFNFKAENLSFKLYTLFKGDSLILKIKTNFFIHGISFLFLLRKDYFLLLKIKTTVYFINLLKNYFINNFKYKLTTKVRFINLEGINYRINYLQLTKGVCVTKNNKLSFYVQFKRYFNLFAFKKLNSVLNFKNYRILYKISISEKFIKKLNTSKVIMFTLKNFFFLLYSNSSKHYYNIKTSIIYTKKIYKNLFLKNFIIFTANLNIKENINYKIKVLMGFNFVVPLCYNWKLILNFKYTNNLIRFKKKIFTFNVELFYI